MARLRNDEPSDSWFEQIQEKVFLLKLYKKIFKIVEILSHDQRFYPSFKKHPLYVKMLEDLGIMGAEESENLLCEGGYSETNSSEPGSCRAKSPSFLIALDSIEGNSVLQTDSTEFWAQTPIFCQSSIDLSEKKFVTKVLVDTLGMGTQGKQMFALYNVRVFKSDIRSGGKNSSSWNVIRRYSDFHTLNETILSRVNILFHKYLKSKNSLLSYSLIFLIVF